MKKLLFMLITGMFVLNVFAQDYPRLMDNFASQTPVSGQSLYSLTISMNPERSVVLSVDDVKIGHFFYGEAIDIAVPDGKHVVRATQMRWDARNKNWREDGNDRLTNTLKGEKMVVEVTTGPKLRDRQTTKLSFTGTSASPAASAVTSPAAASPASSPAASPAISRPIAGSTLKPGIEGAVARASVVFIGELPLSSSIAVISIFSTDTNLSTFAVDELEYQLVTAKKFKIVDRKTLDTIRTEQNFQLSGEVSDQSAVTIGNLLGANYVITGTISGMGNTQRLTLKALDVKTAEIVAMARESF